MPVANLSLGMHALKGTMERVNLVQCKLDEALPPPAAGC